MKATVTYLSSHSSGPSSTLTPLLGRALSTLPSAPQSYQTRFLNALTPLASSHPSLFGPHLNDLLYFLPSVILNKKEYDAGPTPTVARPFPTSGSGPQARAFQFPPVASTLRGNSGGCEDEDNDDDEEREDVRKAALELMVSLSEARPTMVRRVEGWVGALVRACLEGMGELSDDPNELETWLESEVRGRYLWDLISLICIVKQNDSHQMTLQMPLILTILNKPLIGFRVHLTESLFFTSHSSTSRACLHRMTGGCAMAD